MKMSRYLYTFLIITAMLTVLITGCNMVMERRASRSPDDPQVNTREEEPADEGAISYQRAPGPLTGELGAGIAAGPMDGIQSYPSGGNALPNDEPYDLTFFENYGVNPFIATEDEPFSTFAMDVDTASYTIARRFIMDGNLPDPDSVRTEEFINYFDQYYLDPEDGHMFGFTLEGAESEFGRPNYHLLRIGIKSRVVEPDERPAANMVFVVDISGSMDRQDRLEQVKRCLRLLAENLRSQDRVGLVVYGSNGRVISELTRNHDAILNAISELRPGGSTNANEGLTLAYDLARENYDSERINRIILCSDGVANVGLTDADSILEQVKQDALDGITLTALGFGMGNYNDVLMEKLANHGDGCYYYIDSDEEADRLFEDGAVDLLMTIASDAKIQVEFSEDAVDRYRLIGYENRRLDTEDFMDDTVDAGEVGPGVAVSAIYEVRVRDDVQDDPDELLATVRVRYENVETREVEMDEAEVHVGNVLRPFGESSRMFQFVAGVAEFGELLKGSYWAEDGSYESVLETVENLAVNDVEREFIDLVERTIELDARTGG